uniref:Alpha-macroglobulin-like TED domain-containing protein n=2 Tax=Callorhinchus milii TaxID=7868 RepID=A0A4W3GWF5_CALMI
MGLYSDNLGKYLRLPSGCGEQNLAKFSPIIYILRYLTITEQLMRDTEIRALGFLQIGYQQQLLFSHDDGSFSGYGKKDPEGNTW